MSLRVWMPGGVGERFEEELRARLDEGVRLHVSAEPPAGSGARVLVAGRPTEEQLDASSELEAVVIPWAGVPPSTREALAARPALSLHVLHHNAAPTAELALTLLLAAAKRVIAFDRALRRGDWRPRHEDDGGLLLEGRSALVLGLGSIGRRVARALVALGMEVSGTRRRPGGDPEPPGVTVHCGERTEELLAEADAIVCCLPDTPATHGLLGEAAFSRTRSRAVLVNVGRGGLIDEAALWSALEEGRLGAAGLDAWWSYPHEEEARARTAPGRFDWGSRDDVVLSPHRGGHSDRTDVLRAEHLAAALNAAARGEPIPNRVDLEAGY